MAHDFGISRKKAGTERPDWENTTYFFGYCNAVMYKAFHHLECDMVISGSNDSFVISKTEMQNGLKEAIKLFDLSNYPDPKRMDDIKRFLQETEKDNNETEYVIWFG